MVWVIKMMRHQTSSNSDIIIQYSVDYDVFYLFIIRRRAGWYIGNEKRLFRDTRHNPDFTLYFVC
jgi:hypothetical protein